MNKKKLFQLLDIIKILRTLYNPRTLHLKERKFATLPTQSIISDPINSGVYGCIYKISDEYIVKVFFGGSLFSQFLYVFDEVLGCLDYQNPLYPDSVCYIPEFRTIGIKKKYLLKNLQSYSTLPLSTKLEFDQNENQYMEYKNSIYRIDTQTPLSFMISTHKNLKDILDILQCRANDFITVMENETI